MTNPIAAATTEPAAIEPEDKDWTWILFEPCPDCGYNSTGVTGATIGTVLRDAAGRWGQALARPDATVRPEPTVWSVLEYGCHTRDVIAVMTGRLRLMLSEDDPTFPNWDQDESAVAERYWAQDPAVVAGALAEQAELGALAFETVRPEQLSRRGLRSNGSQFTVETLGQYFLHDVVHHLHDIGA